MSHRSWVVDAVAGAPGDLHRSSVDLIAPMAARPALRRVVRILDATSPAVVLGSSEPDRHIDRERAQRRDVAVVRRRSGGAAVLVGPGEALWVDVALPRDDPLWVADVSRAGWWLGACWVEALADVGIAGAQVWRGGMITSAWSPRVCFAGLGPGEVTVAGDKVVGVSQRRSRHGALFQCAVPLGSAEPGQLGRWDPASLVAVLALDPDERARATVELAGVAAAVGDGPALAAALVTRLDQAGPDGLDGPQLGG